VQRDIALPLSVVSTGRGSDHEKEMIDLRGLDTEHVTVKLIRVTVALIGVRE
jgi:hypothetical protein